MTNDPGVLLLLLCFAGLLASHPPCIVNLLSIHKWTLSLNYLAQSSFIATGSMGMQKIWVLLLSGSRVTCTDGIRLKNNEPARLESVLGVVIRVNQPRAACDSANT